MLIENVWRNDFPMLDVEKQRKAFIYMDSASTTLKPKLVADTVNRFYASYTSNVSRSSHFLAEEVFDTFDLVREKVASFINARKDEIIFTHNCTDSINLIAKGLQLEKADEIILSVLEHHSNFLPWYERATPKVVPTDDSGIIDLDNLRRQITNKTKLIAISYISNVTGNIQPVKEIAKIAKEHGVLCLIDAAQAVGHISVDVFDIDCDFLAFSAHKMLGPSGVGVLYVKNEALELLSPSKHGGGMVNKVIPGEIDYLKGYSLFEAGTPNIEGILGLGAAVDYLNQLGMECVIAHLDSLEKYCRLQLNSLGLLDFPFVFADNCHSPIFSFRPKNPKVRLDYIAHVLSDVHSIAVRDGYQCAQPLYLSKNLDGAIRVSLYLYNTIEEVDTLISALKKLQDFIA